MEVNMIDDYGNEISWVPLLKETNKSTYLLIAEAIENDIQNGKLIHGFKLPPQRIIAYHLGISHGTVTRAYKLCEEKGLIRGIIGKGTYVASSAGLPIHLLTDHQDNNIISMGMALPLYEMNHMIESYLKELVDIIDYSIALRYCPPEGHIKHRYIAAEWLKTYDIKCNPENIIITSGTQNALSTILISLFSRGDRIIVDEFTYSGLKSLTKYLGIILVPITGDNFGINIYAFEQACKLENVKGVYLVPDCHNPTSITLSKEKRIEISKIIDRYDLLLIEDAACSFTIENKLKPISSFIPDNSIYIHGTSKSLNPTFRISYIVSPNRYTKQLQNGIINITWMASPLNAEIVSLLQVTSSYNNIVEKKLKILKERNLIFDEVLKGYSFIPSSTSLFRYLLLPKGCNAATIEYLALEARVQIFSANRFFVGTHDANNAIRISISSPKNSDELRRGLNVIKDILSSCEYSYSPIV